MVSVVAPGAEPLLGVVTTRQSTTPPWALYVSRIEIRLLRDTRRVLEYNFPSKKVGHKYQFFQGYTATKNNDMTLTVAK